MYVYDHKKLEFKKIKLTKYIWLIIGIILIFCCISAGITTKIVVETVPVVYRTKPEIFNEELFKQEIFNSNCKFPDIVWQQAVEESGHFKSEKFLKGNNVFGMQYVTQRTHLQLGELGGFARYRSFHESLGDYLLWQVNYAGDINTKEEYYDLLDKVYCKDIKNGLTYSQRLKLIN